MIEHPAVLESAVVSSPDQVRGEVILTVIVHIGMTYIYIYIYYKLGLVGGGENYGVFIIFQNGIFKF